MEVIKAVRREAKGNIITKTLLKNSLNRTTVVWLYWPIRRRFLIHDMQKKEVKDKIIHADQLITYIKKINSESGAEDNGEKYMEQTAR